MLVHPGLPDPTKSIKWHRKYLPAIGMLAAVFTTFAIAGIFIFSLMPLPDIQ
jgi:hypothetical protein